MDANAVLGPPAKEDADENSAVREAEEFPCRALGEERVEAKRALEEAKDVGISERSLKRAKEKLGVVSEREGVKGQRGVGKWYCRLPREEDLQCQPPHTENVGALNQVGALNPIAQDPHETGGSLGQTQMEFRHTANETIKDAKEIKGATLTLRGRWPS